MQDVTVLKEKVKDWFEIESNGLKKEKHVEAAQESGDGGTWKHVQVSHQNLTPARYPKMATLVFVGSFILFVLFLPFSVVDHRKNKGFRQPGLQKGK